MREVQLKSMLNIPNSGMVTTMDVGDIDCIHPANKEVVAERLAYWALAKTYGKKGIVYSAPVYKSMEMKDGKIYITFDDLGYGGLIPVNTPLKSFEIAGTDKVFHPAKAVFDTRTKAIIVWSEKWKSRLRLVMLLRIMQKHLYLVHQEYRSLHLEQIIGNIYLLEGNKWSSKIVVC